MYVCQLSSRKGEIVFIGHMIWMENRNHVQNREWEEMGKLLTNTNEIEKKKKKRKTMWYLILQSWSPCHAESINRPCVWACVASCMKSAYAVSVVQVSFLTICPAPQGRVLSFQTEHNLSVRLEVLCSPSIQARPSSLLLGCLFFDSVTDQLMAGVILCALKALGDFHLFGLYKY